MHTLEEIEQEANTLGRKVFFKTFVIIFLTFLVAFLFVLPLFMAAVGAEVNITPESFKSFSICVILGALPFALLSAAIYSVLASVRIKKVMKEENEQEEREKREEHYKKMEELMSKMNKENE